MNICVICSSHREDRQLLHRLKVHLLGLLREGFSIFCEPLAGDDVEMAFRRELRKADVVIALLSIDLMNELLKILEEELPVRLASGSARLVPVLCRACGVVGTVFAEHVPVTVRGKPVWHQRDQQDAAWNAVIDAIRRPSTRRRAAGGEGPRSSRRRRGALHQIPAPPADFTGRTKEIGDLMAHLGTGGVSVSGLRGPGGIGKTTLAYKLTECLACQYPDAQLYLDFRGSEPESVTPAAAMAHVIHSFEPERRVPEDPAELRAIYLSLLHGQHILLLWDNVRDAEQVLSLIPPAGCLMLITSRHRFGLPGLYAKDLETLEKNEARDLVLTIAPRVGDLAGELAKMCGLLPQAIRVAASTLADLIDLDPHDYLCKLTDEKARRELVDASVHLSYEMLGDELRKNWRQLAVFLGTFDRRGAAAVWKSSVETAQKVLGELVRRSLVEWKEGRYRLHDLVRLCANACMSGEERYAAEHLHAAYYERVLCEADNLYLKGNEDILRGIELLDQAWENIHAGQAWSAAHMADKEELARLCCSYPNAGAYLLLLRRSARERIEWRGAALTAAMHLGDRTMEGAHLGELALAYSDLGEHHRAIEVHKQALILMHEIGDAQNESGILTNLGISYSKLGEYHRAIEVHEQALAIARHIRDSRCESSVLNNLGIDYKCLGQPDRALECYEQALMIARKTGDWLGEAQTCWHLGELQQDQGDLPGAISHMQNCVDLYRKLKHPDAEEYNTRFAAFCARLKMSEPVNNSETTKNRV